MAETQVEIGFGAKLQRGNGAVPEVFTDIVEINDVNPPEFSTDKHEASHHQSPGAHKERIPGMTDTGDIPIKGNLLETNMTQDELTGMLADVRARRIGNWRYVYPNATKTLQVRGFMSRWKGTTPLNGPKQVEATLTPSGMVTFI
jgi:hypothetical protein